MDASAACAGPDAARGECVGGYQLHGTRAGLGAPAVAASQGHAGRGKAHLLVHLAPVAAAAAAREHDLVCAVLEPRGVSQPDERAGLASLQARSECSERGEPGDARWRAWKAAESSTLCNVAPAGAGGTCRRPGGASQGNSQGPGAQAHLGRALGTSGPRRPTGEAGLQSHLVPARNLRARPPPGPQKGRNC